MPSEFPPPLSDRVKLAAAVVLLVTFVYSFVIAAQILLWFVLVGIAAGIYIAWLLVLAVFRLVEAVERLAAAKEDEIRDRREMAGIDAERASREHVAGAEPDPDASAGAASGGVGRGRAGDGTEREPENDGTDEEPDRDGPDEER